MGSITYLYLVTSNFYNTAIYYDTTNAKWAIKVMEIYTLNAPLYTITINNK